MIYTVTFNPSLDYIVGVDEFKTGKVNRTAEELILPGERESMCQSYFKTWEWKVSHLVLPAGLQEKRFAD